MLDRPHPSPRTCARGAGRFAGHAFSRAHWLLPVTSRSDIKGAGAGSRGAVQELQVEGAWEGTPGRPAAGVSAMFYSGLLTEGGRKETDMREAASLRQQRRMKQAVQFIHKDSADLLPLDGLKKLGSSKDTVSSPPSATPVTVLWAATDVQALTATFTESPTRLVAVRSLAGARKTPPYRTAQDAFLACSPLAQSPLSRLFLPVQGRKRPYLLYCPQNSPHNTLDDSIDSSSHTCAPGVV